MEPRHYITLLFVFTSLAILSVSLTPQPEQASSRRIPRELLVVAPNSIAQKVPATSLPPQTPPISPSAAQEDVVVAPQLAAIPLTEQERKMTPEQLRNSRVPPVPLYSQQSQCRRSMRTSWPEYTRKVKSERPRIAVVSLMAGRASRSNNRTEQRMRLFFNNAVQYCQRHGYDFILEGDSLVEYAKFRHASPKWAKIHAVQKWLPYYEWVVWIDSDTLFVDYSRQLEEVIDTAVAEYVQYYSSKMRTQLQKRFGKRNNYLVKNNNDEINFQAEKAQIDFVVIAECLGINSGVLFFRNSSWSQSFLQRVYDTPRKINKIFPFADQDGFAYNLNIFPRGHKMFMTRGKTMPWQSNAAQVELDRRHVLILEETGWNKAWFVIDALLREHLAGVKQQWQYNHLEVAAGKEQPNAALLHFIGCSLVDSCDKWMELEAVSAVCRHKEDAVFSNPTLLAPVEYFPPV